MAESPSSPTSVNSGGGGGCGDDSAHHHTRSLSASLRSVQERRARDEERSGQDDDVRAWLAAQLQSPKYLSKAVPLQSLLKDGVDLCLFAPPPLFLIHQLSPRFFPLPHRDVVPFSSSPPSPPFPPEWSRRT